MNILNDWKMLDLVTRDGEALVCIEGRVYGSNPRFPSSSHIRTSPITGYSLNASSMVMHHQTRLGISAGQTGIVTDFCQQRLMRRLSRLNEAPAAAFNALESQLTGFDPAQESHPRNASESSGKLSNPPGARSVRLPPEAIPHMKMTAGAEAPADSHSVYWTATSSAGLSGQCETLIVGVCGFARITSVASRVACSPSVTLSKPVHPPSGGGGGNRTRVQNASGLPELRPCQRLWVRQAGNSSPAGNSHCFRPACSSRRCRPRRADCAPEPSPETRCWPSAARSSPHAGSRYELPAAKFAAMAPACSCT
jgi:hypothetical protein